MTTNRREIPHADGTSWARDRSFESEGNSNLSAVILAGGAGSRLGGVDKAMLRFEGETLLARIIQALSSVVSEIVIVGQPRNLNINSGIPVTWTLEDPPGGGPLAGLAAGVEKLQAGGPEQWFFALACDQPFAERAIDPLLAAAQVASPDTDGIMGIDQNQRTQALTAIYRKVAVEERLAALGSPEGLPMRALVRDLSLEAVTLPVGASQDVDTDADLRELGVSRPE